MFMEGIIFIIIILSIGIYLNSKIVDLENRLDNLEFKKQKTEPEPILVKSLQTTKFSPAEIEELKGEYLREVQPTLVGNFVNWMRQDLMVKVGALLLLIGLGWFVSYAFANGWIDENGRIALGLLTGTAFLALGTWRINSYRQQGGIFTVVGATTILLTVFAARELYNLFTPLSALIIMFMAVVFVAFVSVSYRSEKLAYAGLILGSFAPLLTNTPVPDTVERLTYLMVVVLGTLWVVWITGWTRLTLTSLVITYLYSLPYFFGLDNGVNQDLAMTFSFLFVCLFFVANMVSLVRRHGQGIQHMATHTITALGTAIFLFTWIEAAATPEWRSLLYVAWAMVFAFGTYVVFLFTANRSAFYLYGATSIALLGVATATELEGSSLTIAYLLEISLLIIAAGKLSVGSRLVSQLSYLLVIPVLLSLESLSVYRWQEFYLRGFFHEDFFVVSLTAIVLFSVGYFIQSLQNKEESKLAEVVSITLLAGGGFYTMALIWLILHSLIEYSLATMLALIIYTIFGITFFVQGKINNQIFLRWSGSILIALVVARLLLIEVWEMELEGRIITFLVIGIMLISTAFIKKINLPAGGQSNDPLQ